MQRKLLYVILSTCFFLLLYGCQKTQSNEVYSGASDFLTETGTAFFSLLSSHDVISGYIFSVSKPIYWEKDIVDYSGKIIVLSGDTIEQNGLWGDVVYFLNFPGSLKQTVFMVVFKDGLQRFVKVPRVARNTAKIGVIKILHEQREKQRYSLILPKEIIGLTYESVEDFSGFLLTIKQRWVHHLLQNGFTGFLSPLPNFTTGAGFMFTGETARYVASLQQRRDSLDISLEKQLQMYAVLFATGTKDEIPLFTYEKITLLQTGVFLELPSLASGVILFRSQQDLNVLGYTRISQRQRVNRDPAYRRHNIATALQKIGYITVLNPGQKFDFLPTVDFDEIEKKNYKEGKSIVEGEVVVEYGGGLCGASTAVYQGIVGNKGLTILSGRNHSIRAHSLYNATIDGTGVSIPGLDATIYSGLQDFSFRNTTDHPIILVSSYDGSLSGVEDIFTLGFPEDRGSYVFSGKYTIGTGTKCYEWRINGTEKTSCYKEVK